MKTCTKCKLEKDEKNFGLKLGKRSARCKICRNEDSKIYRDSNKDLISEERRVYYKTNRIKILAKRKIEWAALSVEEKRDLHYNKNYGISYSDYVELETAQKSKCAICGTKDKGQKGVFYVDHCHSSGNVRGLLCSPCNLGLGLFKDSEEALAKALSYLKKSNEERG